MKKQRILYLIIFICLSSAIYIQAERFIDRYHISFVTMKEGLPHNFVDDLFKDSRGFLWVSTAGGGLSRYDGYDFVNFSPNTPHCRTKSNFIRNSCEDSFRRLWAVSEGGIDIIDLKTLQPTIPEEESGQLKKIMMQPSVRSYKDTKGCIWVQSERMLYRITFQQDGSVAQISSYNTGAIQGPDVPLEDVDHDGRVWVAFNGKVMKMFPVGNKLRAVNVIKDLNLEAGTFILDILNKENEIWVATNHGLYRYNRNSNRLKHYMHSPSDAHSLSQDYLTGLAVTNTRQLLISTLCGINIYDPMTDKFDHINCTSGNDNDKLNSNFVNCMLVDDEHIWIGTETGGINKLNQKRLTMTNFVHSKDNASSLAPNPVNAIYEDAFQTLWVGNVEGGLSVLTKGSDHFAHITKEHGGLSHNSISAITADNKNRLWASTWGGGINLLDLNQRGTVKKIFTSANTPGFNMDFVGALSFDAINKGIWIGANPGIYFYDLTAEKMTMPISAKISNNIHGCIGSIIDHTGKLWVGCMEGVYIIDLKKRSRQGMFSYRHLTYKLDNPSSRLIEKITCFHESKDGTLWLGSNGYGFYKRIVDADGREHFEAFTTEQGLANNSIRGIEEDANGFLWIATNNGLSCYHPKENNFVNYSEQDGIADEQFYWNASYRTAEGKIYFGSVGGLTVIDNNRSFRVTQMPIRFTKLYIGGEEALSGNKYLPEDISEIKELCIHEKEKSFMVEFAALNYSSSNSYSYRLLGFDDKWVNVADDRRYASYTNLPPGTYTLQVKCIPDGVNSGKENIAELKIVIVPYFYKTTWFILLTIIVLSVAVWQFYQARIRTLKRQREYLHRKVEERTKELEEQKQLLQQQTNELSRQNNILVQQNEKITKQKTQIVQMSRKVQELTLDKISFFTNITHEFRTPITLIIGPIERALKLSSNPKVIEQLHFVERNSKYLLSLVNQLMDFRKVEAGKLEIVKSVGNFLDFVHTLVEPFRIFANERNITIKEYIRMTDAYLLFDEEAMHKVFTNLLSNAIKFTPNGGRVSLYIASLHQVEQSKPQLYISVSDTGSGIPEDDLPKIFNRFYQSKNQIKYPVYGQAGSGIGLYLCKRIVQMHGGEISARNNHSQGCSFRVMMPLQVEASQGRDSKELNDELQSEALSIAEPQEKSKLTMLVVEDNADMRGYIRSILIDKYNVLEAENGQEALQILNQQIVDFVVSDLMMPVMDGIELSKRVKETFSISHIPFLMLTAKTSPEARLESYRMGVDEYLLKPFDETLLLTRIENILENRKRYQRQFTMDMNVEDLHIEEESSDKRFLNKIMEVIKENYKNSYFEGNDFCEAMGVSKSLLNKKLQSLIGQSSGQFIRNYRLNIARELIMKNRKTKNMNISEVAYEVGFNDPKYFTRCFTKQFSVSPSAMLNEAEN
jgi:signal transduction histidine kinase/ligand-binding sensor domain-containing protein/CheY-like chemotaxis protein